MKRNRYSKNRELEISNLKKFLARVQALGGRDALIDSLLKAIQELEDSDQAVQEDSAA
tara:strand:+ start:431 stop:604 length:174 start_codon:yes stop_codon:yes gene_type:complete